MSRLYHYCQQYEIDSKPTAEPFDGYMSNQPPSKCIHIVYCPKTKKNPIDAAIDRADLFVYFEFLFREKKKRAVNQLHDTQMWAIETVEMVSLWQFNNVTGSQSFEVFRRYISPFGNNHQRWQQLLHYIARSLITFVFL